MWRLADRNLDLAEPLTVGIVNVTVDSMFEGARSETPEQAVRDGMALVGAGFEMLDIGAVAARNGPPVPTADEIAALIPTVRMLAGSGLPVSADTYSVEVARRALEAGAVLINDISGGSEEMLGLIAETGAGYVLMHIEGPPRVAREWPEYADVVDHLKSWFERGLDLARSLGVDEEQIAIDPGLDFDLSPEHDLEILRRLAELGELGRPLYISLSRKDFIGALLGGSWRARRPPAEREWGTAAAAALAVANGADVLRLHDQSSLQAVRVAAQIRRLNRSPA